MQIGATADEEQFRKYNVMCSKQKWNESSFGREEKEKHVESEGCEFLHSDSDQSLISIFENKALRNLE